MKKYLSAVVMIFFLFSSRAQDTLSIGEKNIIGLFGGIFNIAKEKMMADMRTNGNRSILGNALRETIGGIFKSTKDRILSNGAGNLAIDLPSILNKQQPLLTQRGKANLLSDFKSSLKTAAQNALNNSLLNMADQLLELDVNALVNNANSETLSFTDLFKNTQHNKMVGMIKPVAKTAFKLSGGKKLYNKIAREVKKGTSEKLSLDNEELIATKAVDYFFESMMIEENDFKKNPLNALGDVINGLFNK